ncbi:MAG: uncharacterized protein HW390_2203 [Candidatus Brocadiaceae bacterium]|nr:uncharacterized protein [Candidatus Brocadiaceae bacterium]
MPNLKDVYEVADVIKGACNPHAIILFGSLSRGDKGNDIDLLIVTNKRAEKIVKWALLKRGWELENAHSIRRLIAIAKDHGINLTLRDEEVDFIDSIYKGRYPGEDGLLPLGNPTKRDAKKALQIAQNITEQIEAHVE